MDEDPRYDNFPMDEACERAAIEMRAAAADLDLMVYTALHPGYEYGEDCV